jgi:hypothetical protein
MTFHAFLYLTIGASLFLLAGCSASQKSQPIVIDTFDPPGRDFGCWFYPSNAVGSPNDPLILYYGENQDSNIRINRKDKKLKFIDTNGTVATFKAEEYTVLLMPGPETSKGSSLYDKAKITVIKETRQTTLLAKGQCITEESGLSDEEAKKAEEEFKKIEKEKHHG